MRLVMKMMVKKRYFLSILRCNNSGVENKCRISKDKPGDDGGEEDG